MLPDTHALGLDPGRLDTALTAACRAPSLHNSNRGGSASART